MFDWLLFRDNFEKQEGEEGRSATSATRVSSSDAIRHLCREKVATGAISLF